jgi:hypothetical protein
VPGTVLAAVFMNSEGGSYLTFAFPIILFCVIASVLYVLLFGRPHRRVPPRRAVVTSQAAAGNVLSASAGATAADGGAEPQQDTATDGTEASE